MAHSNQARKRTRQSEKRRIRNKSVKNEIKTLTKTLREKVGAKDLEGAKAVLRKVTSRLDKATKNHVFHRNSAARRKSAVATLVQRLATPPGAEAGSAGS